VFTQIPRATVCSETHVIGKRSQLTNHLSPRARVGPACSRFPTTRVLHCTCPRSSFDLFGPTCVRVGCVCASPLSCSRTPTSIHEIEPRHFFFATDFAQCALCKQACRCTPSSHVWMGVVNIGGDVGDDDVQVHRQRRTPCLALCAHSLTEAQITS
jgi:hypothetical protein